MATQLVRNFGTPAALTSTLVGLVFNAGRETDALSLSATAEDYEAVFTFRTLSGTHSGDFAVYVYACPSPTGTMWPTPSTGTDAAIVITTASNQLKGPILVVPFGTSATGLATQTGVIPSLKAALGELPAKLTFAIQNSCCTFDSTAGNLSVTVIPVWNTVTT